MSQGIAIEITAAFRKLEFLGSRRPESYADGPEKFAARLADYRDGGVFIAHWAGLGEWECHPNGDEVVMVLEGEAKVFLVEEGRVIEECLEAGGASSQEARRSFPTLLAGRETARS